MPARASDCNRIFYELQNVMELGCASCIVHALHLHWSNFNWKMHRINMTDGQYMEKRTNYLLIGTKAALDWCSCSCHFNLFLSRFCHFNLNWKCLESILFALPHRTQRNSNGCWWKKANKDKVQSIWNIGIWNRADESINLYDLHWNHWTAAHLWFSSLFLLP